MSRRNIPRCRNPAVWTSCSQHCRTGQPESSPCGTAQGRIFAVFRSPSLPEIGRRNTPATRSAKQSRASPSASPGTAASAPKPAVINVHFPSAVAAMPPTTALSKGVITPGITTPSMLPVRRPVFLFSGRRVISYLPRSRARGRSRRFRHPPVSSP